MVSQTVEKALRIMEALGDGEARLVDIAAELGEHKSNVQRLLATLESRGFVRQDQSTRRYSLGIKILQLASEVLTSLDLRTAAQDVLYEINDLTGETVHLGIYDEMQVVYIDKRESTYPIRMYSRVGARAECYCTGVGKAIIAFLPDGELQRYLENVTFTRYTPRTITTGKKLHEEIARIRSLGYARDEQEHEEGVRCVAAPVFGFGGDVVGSISVAAPAFRKSADEIEALAPELMEAAR
ncbi:MAG: IclR family transcriptional regulator, partial [Rubrobacteraceae bacterium]